MSENTEYEIKVNDWGPCFHSDSEAKVVQDWIDHLVSERPKSLLAHGGQMEDFAWLINLQYNGLVEFESDQWVGVGAQGTLWKVDEEERILDQHKKWRYSIYLQSDSFLGGIAGVYACLKWLQAEINEGFYDENYCSVD
jgi:hypothetical protein